MDPGKVYLRHFVQPYLCWHGAGKTGGSIRALCGESCSGKITLDVPKNRHLLSPIIAPSAHAEAQSVALDSLHVLILARWITPSDDFDKVSSSSESRQLLEPFLRDDLRSLDFPKYPAVRSHLPAPTVHD